jgi:hypothetical protein
MDFKPRSFYRDVRSSPGVKFQALCALYYTYVGLWVTYSTRLPHGRHVFDEEWDLLIVLDTCRVDALREVADEYDFIEDVDSIWSLGSASVEWLSHTFDAAYADTIEETAYVTSKIDTDTIFHEQNYPPDIFEPPVQWPAWDVVDLDQFGHIEEVWRDNVHEEFMVTAPESTTDAAIEVDQQERYDRRIVHYQQPHTPYIATPSGIGIADSGQLSSIETDPLPALQNGEISHETVWGWYLDNLRLVLNSVDRLLSTLDFDRAVITADHGEGFGDYGVYGHPIGCPTPEVKRVPWSVITPKE